MENVYPFSAKCIEYLQKYPYFFFNSQSVFFSHFSLQGWFRFEGSPYATIQELLHYQHGSGLPITKRSSAVLRNPVPKEKWQLNNDDIELKDKIGKVS